jgi:hypothetical protein
MSGKHCLGGVGYRHVMIATQPPNYEGRGLVNLMAEVEYRLTGSASSTRLDDDLAQMIPDGQTYVVVLFDGLGAGQLGHRAATDLASSMAATLDAPFPATTTVSLATVATGLPPSQHGIIAYKLWMPEVDTVVNTIHMTTPFGEAIEAIDHENLLPRPNLWERVAAQGVEPIVVQPGNFQSTPLTKTLYRGARFEGYWSLDDAVNVTRDLALPGRLVFLYVPHIDFAAHLSGQDSSEYTDAMALANEIWSRLGETLGNHVTLIGTADHGHVDIDEASRFVIDQSDIGKGFISEDGRVIFVHGNGVALARRHGGQWIPLDGSVDWWGPGPFHSAFAGRAPDGIVFLPQGVAVFSDQSNRRLIGYHGSADPAEVEIPLLVRHRIQESAT